MSIYILCIIKVLLCFISKKILFLKKILKLLFIYLRESEPKREREGAEAEREADSPPNGEPDIGLDSRTLRL